PPAHHGDGGAAGRPRPARGRRTPGRRAHGRLSDPVRDAVRMYWRRSPIGAGLRPARFFHGSREDAAFVLDAHRVRNPKWRAPLRAQRPVGNKVTESRRKGRFSRSRRAAYGVGFAMMLTALGAAGQRGPDSFVPSREQADAVIAQ